MSETGSVKFSCEHVANPLQSFAELDELNACRRKLLHLRVMGVDENGIGFGNISVRDGHSRCFYISGSGTGGLADLALRDCAYVAAYDLAQNWVRSEGTTIASSESLTHAALYVADATIGAVLHGHSAALWNQLVGDAPTTLAEVEYGTPAMAREVQRLFRQSDVRVRRLFVMGGHADGFVAFGRDLQEAFAVLMKEITPDRCGR